MIDREHIFELSDQGLSTGKIALAIGLPRNPQSRQRIRNILRGPRPLRPKHLRKDSAEKYVKAYGVDAHVRRSTGHKFYPKRKSEAEFILEQFSRYECKFKDDTQDWLDSLDLDRISPEDLFRLRDMYVKKRKIFG